MEHLVHRTVQPEGAIVEARELVDGAEHTVAGVHTRGGKAPEPLPFSVDTGSLGRAAWAREAGRKMRNAVPPSDGDSTVSSPSCRLTMEYAVASPSPLPRCLVEK